MRFAGRGTASLLVLFLLAGSSFAASKAAVEPSAKAKQRMMSRPLLFEPNQGQVDSRVKFLSRGQGYSLYLLPEKAVLGLSENKSAPVVSRASDTAAVRTFKRHYLQMELTGANRKARAEALELTPTVTNYFLGNDPKQWREKVPNYERVRFKSVYPGVNVVYYGNQNQLEYDFEVAPGADPSAIQLRFRGASQVTVNKEGDLVLAVNGREVRFQKPFLYQERGGEKVEIAGSYVVKPGNRVSFRVGQYDRGAKLVIDPVLLYSRYFGASGFEQTAGVQVNTTNLDTYVAGYTYSDSLPAGTTAGNDASCGVTTACTASQFADLFIARFDGNGTLLTTTYIGGDDHEQADFSGVLALDSSGNVYLTGYSFSDNFPVVSPFSGLLNGTGSIGNPPASDAVLIKLNAALDQVLYSTYYGGSGSEFSHGVAVDTSGNMYLVGSTISANFPDTVEGTCTGFSQDGFAVRLIPDGSGINYSRCLGGTWLDSVRGVAVEPSGDAYLTGYTASDDFPQVANPITIVNGGVHQYTGFSTNISNEILGRSIISLAHSPVPSSKVMLAGTGNGLYRTTNDGIIVGGSFPAPGWSLLGGSIPSNAVFRAVAFSGSTAIAAVDNGVYIGANEGTDWSFGVTPSVGFINELQTGAGGFVYAAGNTGVSVTQNAGQSWSVLAAAQLAGLSVLSVAPHPTNSGILYIAVSDPGGSASGIYKSVDAGATFQISNSGLTNTEIQQVVIDASSPAILYATDGQRVFRSTNAAGSWIELNPPVFPDVIAVDPAFGYVYVSGIEGIFKSFDHGGTWDNTFADDTLANAFAFDPVNTPGRAYYGTQVYNAFITRLQPDGQILFSQHFGGAGFEQGLAITLDTFGTPAITGYSSSFGLPGGGGFSPFPYNGVDGFVATFDIEGAPLYSTFVGGDGEDVLRAIAPGPNSQLWVAGYASRFAPQRFEIQDVDHQQTGMYVALIDPAATTAEQVAFATHLTGGGFGTANGVAASSATEVVVAGHTDNATFPVFNAQTTSADGPGGSDAVLFKISLTDPQTPPDPPVLTRIVSVNSAEEWVLMEGSNFLPGMKVTFNFSQAASFYISPTLVKFFPNDGREGTPTYGEVYATNPGSADSNTLRFELLVGGWNINFLNPGEAPLASASREVTVNGINFKSDLTVTVNGEARTTTYVSPNQMRVRLTEADLATPGALQLRVVSAKGVTSLPAAFNVTDFALKVSRSELNLRAGQAVTLDLEVAPVNGSFSADVALSCENVPSFLQCQLGSVSVQPGAAVTKTTVRIADRTAGSTAAMPVRSNPFGIALWLPLPAVVLLGVASRRRRMAVSALVIAVLLAMLVMQTGCAGGMNSQSLTSPTVGQGEAQRAPGAYLIKVVGTANGVSRSSQVIVNVE